jgi:hypothetical protein
VLLSPVSPAGVNDDAGIPPPRLLDPRLHPRTRSRRHRLEERGPGVWRDGEPGGRLPLQHGDGGAAPMSGRAAAPGIGDPGFGGPAGFGAPAGFGVGSAFSPEWGFGAGSGLLFGFRGRVRGSSTRPRPVAIHMDLSSRHLRTYEAKRSEEHLYFFFILFPSHFSLFLFYFILPIFLTFLFFLSYIFYFFHFFILLLKTFCNIILTSIRQR